MMTMTANWRRISKHCARAPSL